jgi:hypothetical protein
MYPTGTINVIFNDTIDGSASISKSLHVISTYQGDWMQKSRWCPFPPGIDPTKDTSAPSFQYSFSIGGVPTGEHTLNITVQGQGGYWENGTEYSFVLHKTVSVKFSVGSDSTADLPDAPKFPVVPFVAVSAIVIVSAVAGVIVYFQKRKR